MIGVFQWIWKVTVLRMIQSLSVRMTLNMDTGTLCEHDMTKHINIVCLDVHSLVMTLQWLIQFGQTFMFQSQMK